MSFINLTTVLECLTIRNFKEFLICPIDDNYGKHCLLISKFDTVIVKFMINIIIS